MRARWLLLLGGLVTLAIGLGVVWLTGGLVGKPQIQLSGGEGTVRVFPVTVTDAGRAVTSAFDHFRYHRMGLTGADYQDWHAPGWQPTNGFLLVPDLGPPLTKIPVGGPLGRRWLPYVATFRITISPLGTNRARIAVQTLESAVLDGLTVGHGGTGPAHVAVAPVQQEEQRILDAVASELTQEGAPKATKGNESPVRGRAR